MSSATLKHIAIEDKDLKAGTTIPNVTLTRYEHGEDVEIVSPLKALDQ